MANYSVNINEEIAELRGQFPNVDRSDFYELDNGNIGVIVNIDTTGSYSKGLFEVMIEYPPGYPNSPPKAWVMSPEVDGGCGHIYNFDENGHANICFTGDRNWSPEYTSYDAAAMVKSWIFGYCKWEQTGEWGWNEAGFIDYLLE